MKSGNLYFLLYSNCIPVKGYMRSIICDLQRSNFELISNELWDVLSKSKKRSIDELKALYGNEKDNEIDEFIVTLIEKEFGFLTEEPLLFPELDLAWDIPSVIHNSIIDVDKTSKIDFKRVFRELDELGCQAVQLRFFAYLSISELNEILINLDSTSIKSVEINLKYRSKFTIAECKKLLSQNNRVTFILVHSAPSDRIISAIEGGAGACITTSQVMDSETHCGFISPATFSINLSHFSEAQYFNTCLNRKISIDKDGEIKNCPSFSKSYGNIATVRLKDIVRMKEFISVWSINKDQISICKDCEFRYICTDCRAYRQEEDDIYSKPLKCDYNPYTGT